MRIFSVILLAGAFLLMVGVAFNYQNRQKQMRAVNAAQLTDIHFWELLPVPVLERNRMINESLKSLDSFIRSVSIADKATATSSPLDNIGKMTSYYNSNAMEVLPGRPSLQALALLNVDGRNFFVLTVSMAGDGGRSEIWEVVFTKNEEGEWMLDWPQFVRYQGATWKDFVSGDGPDEAEFRLWVSRESALDSEDEYCLKFYEPAKNGRSELGISCPDVMVRKDSKLGKEIYRMLKINELQPEAYKNVFSLNPGKGYMRIRAVLAKKQNPETKKWAYSLKKIIGEGWFSPSR